MHPNRAEPVGACVRQWADTTRPSWSGASERPLRAMIWYPAQVGVRAKDQRIAIFRTGRYALELGDLHVAEERHPLVVVSHGTGGSAASIAWLCQRLASAGFVVAALNHHGATAAEPDGLTLAGAVLWWERAVDISRLLDALLADADFAERIDSSRIFAAGFSIGAYTALAVAGARLDIERWRPFCEANPGSPLCRVPPEARFSIDQVWDFVSTDERARMSLPLADRDHRDPRVRSVAAIAPVTVPLLNERSLSSMTAPVLIVAARDDDQSLLDVDALPLHRSLRAASLTTIENAGHYAFVSPGTLAGRIVARRIVGDPPPRRRRRIHDTVARDIARFFLES